MEEKERAAGAATVTQCKDNRMFLLPKRRRELLRLFLSGERLTSIAIVERLKMADPRSEIRLLRKDGYKIEDTWVHTPKTKYKVYFMRIKE